MRNSHISVARSSANAVHRHPQLAFADGYDFDRARSTESTENALAAKNSSAFPSLETASSFASSATAEDRGVPVSPKKLPLTPPRDRGSPYRPQEPVRQDLLQPRSNLGQPFLSPPSQSSGPLSQPFLRPSSWRNKEEDHGSIFRSGPAVVSAENEGYFTIQRSYAFDEDDDSDSEL